MRRPSAIVAVLLAAGSVAPSARAQPVGEQDVVVDVPPGDEYADTDPSPQSDFSPALDPYGAWVDDPTYGMVWAPSPDQVGAGFQPYDTAGSWNYVDGDYVWVSEYAWGWICFHYGRWVLSAGRWVWIPGRRYAGAWVSWRVSDDGSGYVGWSPMAPTWCWTGGTVVALSFAPPEPWVFSPSHDLLLPGTSSHIVSGGAASAIAPHTRTFVPAQPSVAAGPVSPSSPHGPPPATVGIDVARLTLPALGAQELRARQLARPSTALALGARPPARHVFRATRLEIAPRGLTGDSRGTVRAKR